MWHMPTMIDLLTPSVKSIILDMSSFDINKGSKRDQWALVSF